MSGGVRHEVGGQPGQLGRNARVWQYTRSDDHLARENRGFLGEFDLESAAARRHARHGEILNVGHQLFA